VKEAIPKIGAQDARAVLLFSYDALAASTSKPPTYFAGLKGALLGTGLD
jgi:hypothetical protein